MSSAQNAGIPTAPKRRSVIVIGTPGGVGRKIALVGIGGAPGLCRFRFPLLTV